MLAFETFYPFGSHVVGILQRVTCGYTDNVSRHLGSSTMPGAIAEVFGQILQTLRARADA